MTFHAWLKQFRGDETAIGDLARDVVRDRCFPRGLERDRLDRYERHMTEAHDAAPAAVETLRRAWALYKGRS